MARLVALYGDRQAVAHFQTARIIVVGRKRDYAVLVGDIQGYYALVLFVKTHNRLYAVVYYVTDERIHIDAVHKFKCLGVDHIGKLYVVRHAVHPLFGDYRIYCRVVCLYYRIVNTRKAFKFRKQPFRRLSARPEYGNLVLEIVRLYADLFGTGFGELVLCFLLFEYGIHNLRFLSAFCRR